MSNFEFGPQKIEELGSHISKRVKKIVGRKVHTREELRVIIRKLLNNEK